MTSSVDAAVLGIPSFRAVDGEMKFKSKQLLKGCRQVTNRSRRIRPCLPMFCTLICLSKYVMLNLPTNSLESCPVPVTAKGSWIEQWIELVGNCYSIENKGSDILNRYREKKTNCVYLIGGGSNWILDGCSFGYSSQSPC